MRKPVSTAAYREPDEFGVLFIILAVLLAVLVFTASVTLCGSVLAVAGLLALSYSFTRSHHETLLRKARRVHSAEMPNLATLVEDCRQKLLPGDVQTFVVPGKMLNAYTFGLSDPKVIVLYSGLFQIMDKDELRFIIGHEMGHVRLGHTWLNSLIGGMAGIPSSYFLSALFALALRGWNRICEHSADRAGLLACANPDKSISALVKLVAPDADLSDREMAYALKKIDAEDDDPMNIMGEFLSTHPMLIRRIERLKRYALTEEYRKLQVFVNGNVA